MFGHGLIETCVTEVDEISEKQQIMRFWLTQITTKQGHSLPSFTLIQKINTLAFP